jgi:small ligand-binding sensory domain FIST
VAEGPVQFFRIALENSLMPFSAALSTNSDTRKALDEVCAGALDALREQPDLALIFFSPHHAGELERQVGELHGRLGPNCVLGCSGEAIIGNEQEVEQQPAVSLWLARWVKAVRMEPFHLTFEQTPAGLTIGGLPDSVALAGPRQSTMLLLSDPYTFGADAFLRQVNEKFTGLRVLGGMASGGQAPGPARLLLGKTMPRHGAVGVLLSGSIAVRGVVSQGCRPIGQPLVVTAARDNILLELEGRPPLARLQSLWPNLGPRDQQLAQRELLVGLRVGGPAGEWLVRSTLDLDRGSGALKIDDRVAIGQTVQFLVRDATTASENLHLLLRMELEEPKQKPGGALLFTCTRRGSRLFSEPNHDAGALRAEAGNIPVAGFFALGEIGPVGDQSFLHAHSASVAFFGD